MRIFVAGATGVIGRPLVKRLVDAGHVVAGMTRSAERAKALGAVGAQPVVCDVYDAAGLRDAVVAFRPECVIHELTDLPDEVSRIPQFAAANSRIRREGTRNLLDAAGAAGCPRFLAESVAWELPGDGGVAKADLERAVLAHGGVVLRYGRFYGPGTYHEHGLPEAPYIHVDEAARRTAELLDAKSGIIELAENP
jgi:nucleoside-diphosphate-sugar epimerase